MKNDLLFFQPIPRKTIWGKNVVKEFFHYEEFEYGVGQAWAFADQPGGLSNLCVRGAFKGKTFHEIWNRHPEIFQSRFQCLPVIISLVGPSEDLSIQVHPGRKLAREKGFSMGKNEAWYFLEANNSSYVYGHRAENQEELIQRIKEGRWDRLFTTVPAETGDFVYIPSGTIHALGKSNVVYEIQQATDLTFRIYDYDRVDENGNKRELHLPDAIASIQEKSENEPETGEKEILHTDELTITQFISNESFTVIKVLVNGRGRIEKNGYWLCTVVKGAGSAGGEDVKLGDNFVIGAQITEIPVEGCFELLITSETGYAI